MNEQTKQRDWTIYQRALELEVNPCLLDFRAQVLCFQLLGNFVGNKPGRPLANTAEILGL